MLIGDDVLLVRKLKIQLGSILLAVFLVVGSATWQGWYSHTVGRTASGSSLPGLVIGSIAALIILFELLLWPRKKLRRWKLFPTKFWLAAHLWLGLAVVPLAFIHSGYRFGGAFTTFLIGLLFFVVASGVYGWIMQSVIPKWMLGNLLFETIGDQIDDVSIQSVLDARRMLTVAFGPKPEGLRKLANLDQISSDMRATSTIRESQADVSSIVVGAMQRRGLQRSKIDVRGQGDFNINDGLEVWKQYAAVIEPFLLHDITTPGSISSGKKSIRISPVRTHQKSIDWFSLLRESCSQSAIAIVDRLEQLCEQRHQFDAQRRAHAWLHGWIAFHAGTSILLGVLLVTHIFLSLKYR